MELLPTEAVDRVVAEGAWAALCIILITVNVWLISRLLKHGEGSHTAILRIAVALEALTGRIDGLTPKGDNK